MNIVIIGLGEVGKHLLSVLDKEGHDIVAVDASPRWWATARARRY